jgi:hypothetical protein
MAIALVFVVAAGLTGWNYLSAPIVQMDDDGNIKAVCTRDGKVHTPEYLKTYKGGYTTEPVDRWYVPKFTANP